MKSFLVIGTGTFGHHLCRALADMGCQFVIADINGDAMSDLVPLAACAKICDCTNPSVLKSFGVEEFDACFVCVGNSLQNCLEITDQLNELGAKRVLSKANDEREAKFLRRCGADEIIFPEKEAAVRLAVNASSDNIFDFFDLGPDCSLYEIVPPKAWLGKDVIELNVRTNYGLNIVAIKRNGSFLPFLDASYKFNTEEHVLVMGSMKAIRAVT